MNDYCANRQINEWMIRSSFRWIWDWYWRGAGLFADMFEVNGREKERETKRVIVYSIMEIKDNLYRKGIEMTEKEANGEEEKKTGE